MPARKHSRNRFLGAIAISVAAHLCFVPVTASLWPDAGDVAPVRYSAVTLVPISVPEPAERPEEPRRQHVELPPPETESEPPPDTRFADRFDRRVERETVADDIGAPTPPSGASAARRGTDSGDSERTVAASIPSEASEDRVRAITDHGRRTAEERESDSILPTHIDSAAEPSRGAGAPDAVSPVGDGIDLTIFNAPGEASLTARQGERLDHIQLEESDRTLVNSARSIYWSFFTRMKRQVQVEWDPVGVYRRADPSGRIYRQQDRYTVLAVTLGSDGGLAEAAVERSSGLDFLDEEAVRAFRSASPFPNVPEGLKDEQGFVDVRFGFLLSLGGSVRIERLPEF